MDVFSGNILIAFLLTFLTAFCRQDFRQLDHLHVVQEEYFPKKNQLPGQFLHFATGLRFSWENRSAIFVLQSRSRSGSKTNPEKSVTVFHFIIGARFSWEK
jgi:hypothetical protein